MKLTFLGATNTVTGSKYLLETSSGRILIDCGLFQGEKELRLRNWARFPVDPASIDAVLITHAHVDHTGYLPVLVKEGFRGPIYCTPATLDLCRILLPDSGYLQEEQAGYANRKGFSRHKPALPLYTRDDAERSLTHLRPVDFHRLSTPIDGLTFEYLRAGHILGAAMLRIQADDTSILFSGDLGRPTDPILLPPERVQRADYLVLESTYGDRLHDPTDPLDMLEAIINRTIAREGVVIIPSFAVGRTQTILYYLHLLRQAGRLPPVPVYLNSPMAISASRIFFNHEEEHRLSRSDCEAMDEIAHYVRSVEESKALNRKKEPMIIISASGMAAGGRVLHHIAEFGPDPRNTILFVGFQAAGTRGAAMMAGAAAVKIHGSMVPIQAEVANINNLSAHADQGEIMDWLGAFSSPPHRTFITHGEPEASKALKLKIEASLGWKCHLPEYAERVVLE